MPTKITHEDIVNLMTAIRNDNPERCIAKIMNSEPTQLDKEKVLGLKQILFIPFAGKYQMGFCNNQGKYEQVNLDNAEIEHLKSLTPVEAKKYIETDKFKDQINNELLTLGSKSKLETNYGNKEGVCRGFTFMWARALAQGDRAEANFYDRLKTITKYKNYNNNFQSLINDINQVRGDIKRMAQRKKPIEEDIKSYKERQKKEDMTGKTESAYKDTIESLEGKLKEYDEELQMFLEEKRDLLEIPAFTDGIELSQSPFRHSDLFQEKLAQADVKKIAPMSAALDTSPLDVLTKRSPYNSINSDQLKEYFAKLEEIFNRYPEKPPIIMISAKFRNGGHGVSCQFDKDKKQWKYLDVNDFQRFPNEPSYFRSGTIDALTKELLKSYEKNDDGSIELFRAEFICPEDKLQAFSSMAMDIDKMDQSLKIKIDYPILTPEIITKTPDTTLGWLAQLNANDKKLVNEIIDIMVDIWEISPDHAATFLKYLEENPSIIPLTSKTLLDIATDHLEDSEEEKLKHLYSTPTLKVQEDYSQLTPEIITNIPEKTLVWLAQLNSNEKEQIKDIIDIVVDIWEISPEQTATFLKYLEKNPDKLPLANETLVTIADEHLEDTEENKLKLLFLFFPSMNSVQEKTPELKVSEHQAIEVDNTLIKSDEGHDFSRSHQIMKDFKKEIQREAEPNSDKKGPSLNK